MSALFSLTRVLQSRGHDLVVVATASDLIALAAYSKDDIKRLYGAQIEAYLAKYNASESVDDYILSIYNADPTADKTWMGQITKWVLEKRPEDLETEIKEYLSKFAEILSKNPGKFGGLAKQLAKGKVALSDLKTVVQENQDKSTVDLKIQDKVGGFPKVAENDEYACYKIDKWVEGPDDKHKAFQGNVDWCVKYKEKFDGYKPPYFMFIEKATGKEYALFHVDSKQLKNVRNEGMRIDELKPIYDLIESIVDVENISRNRDFSVFNVYDMLVKNAKYIKGDLDLHNTKITSLPEGLSVGGGLYLRNTPITSLPEGLSVGGYLDLRNTPITSLPEGLSVGGDFDLRNTQITSLPEGMSVGGYFDLSNTKITSLPEGLSVGGCLYLRNTPITSLPEGLSVGGDLDLSNTQITSLPEGLFVGGDFDLRSTQITSLPEGMSVGGYFDLSNTKITSLPEGLSVGGSLDISNTKITSLPEGLSVGGDLDISNTKITSLPEGLSVGGKIYR